MTYKHGVYFQENPTTFEQPLESVASQQVVFGVAPINLAENINAVVNQPVIAHDFEDAKKKLGYSDNWSSYTLCEAMDASFKQIKVGPVVFVNVLDPSTHIASESAVSLTPENDEVTIQEEGIILDSIVLNNDSTPLEADVDYLATFDDDGYVHINLLTSTTIGNLTADYDKLDPSMITNQDIIGGYDATNDEYRGIENVRIIFPKFSLVPSILTAPGYSSDPEVGSVLVAKSESVNGSFKTENVIDLSANTPDDALSEKISNVYNDRSSLVCWPKAKVGGKTYHLSSLVAAVLARTDAENGDVPYKSPSNKRLPIEAAVDGDGNELFLDQIQGNRLNGKGIVTVVNMRGWRVWGNNTAKYDYESSQALDPKDRFISVRRMFNWWGNSFILNYFDRVDDPTSYRLIESVVDSENIRANGFQARGQIAGAKIEFRKADNPTAQILDGKIQFIQKIGFLTPAKEISNVLEFDPTILNQSLFGGE